MKMARKAVSRLIIFIPQYDSRHRRYRVLRIIERHYYRYETAGYRKSVCAAVMLNKVMAAVATQKL